MFPTSALFNAVALSLVAAAMARPAIVPRQSTWTIPQDCSRNLTVQLGETCDIIGDFYGVSKYVDLYHAEFSF
jgi:hypothetical protein